MVMLFLAALPATVSAEGPWSNLGSLGNDGAITNGSVLAIAVSGNDVYVGGTFTDLGGNPAADYIARWDGTSWHSLGSRRVCSPFSCSDNGALTSDVKAIAIEGTNVYVGGGFIDAAGIAEADTLAVWNAQTQSWSAVDPSHSYPPYGGALLTTGSGGVNALAVSNGILYVGGPFRNAANIPEADALVRWDGTNWSALGGYVFQGQSDGALLCTQLLNGQPSPCRNNTRVNAIAVDGPNVYVGCTDCRDVMEHPTWDNVLVWDGGAWQGLGANSTNDNGAISEGIHVRALVLGPAGELYVGGGFTEAADIPDADYLARWFNGSWSAVGGNGVSGVIPPPANVYALTFFGSDLYAGGSFKDANGDLKGDGIIKWNGSSWVTLGDNGLGDGAMTSGCCTGSVYALAASSGDVYAGGSFFNAGGIVTADNVARWNIVPPSLTGITVTPGNTTIPAGTTQQFTATGGYNDGSSSNITGSVTWESSNQSAATINTTGLAQAVGAGLATTISATLGQISGTATLNVSAPTLVSVAVTPVNPSIPQGGTQQFTATGTYSDSSTQDVTTTASWTSGTPAVASIGLHSGLASGLARGLSVVTASLGGKSGNTTLTVGGPVPTLTYTGATAAAPGANITLSAALTSGGAALTGRTITFKLNGATLTGNTNRNGVASVKTTAPATTGQFTVQVSFAGDATFSAASISANLSVKFATRLTYTGPTRTTASAAITLSATLATTAGAAISGVPVTFTLNGATLQANTNGSGVASLGTTAPAIAGKYTISVNFAGDSAYSAASASASLTVR
jgi:hypothetical protein